MNRLDKKYLRILLIYGNEFMRVWWVGGRDLVLFLFLILKVFRNEGSVWRDLKEFVLLVIELVLDYD